MLITDDIMLYFLLIQIDKTEDGEVTLGDYEVVSIESKTEIDRKKGGLSLSLSPSRIPPQNIQTPNGPEDESGRWNLRRTSAEYTDP